MSFVHIFKQKGFKLKGLALCLKPSDEGFKERYLILKEIAGEKFPIREVIRVDVKSIESIVAPSYFLFPDITEEEQIKNAKKIYGL